MLWQQKQQQVSYQHQKVIQDQNYSHQILYMVLSSIQSLYRAFMKQPQKSGYKKIFAFADVVDYRNKNLKELKSQLHTHLSLFKTSRMVFQMENPGVQWTLPTNFSREQIFSFIRNCCQSFKEDNECIQLAQATWQILGGKYEDLYIDKQRFDVKYSASEKEAHKKEFLQNGITAGEEMDKRKQQVQKSNIKDSREFTANFETSNPIFQQQKTAKGQRTKEEKHKAMSQKPKEEESSIFGKIKSVFTGKKIEPMELE